MGTVMSTAGEGGSSGGADAAPVPSAEELKLYALHQKYTAEAAKRFRPDFASQFVPLKEVEAERVRTLSRDPWVDHAALNAREPVKDGARYKFVILGAGYGALILAVRLIEAGLAKKGAKDILIVDNGGGFGGTWYWNRYPGLHCDIESYIYMPLLEETGYVPKSKYSTGEELRQYAELVANKWGLDENALFRTKINTARWSDEKQLWEIALTEGRGPEEKSRELHLEADYFLTASGVFPEPQVPKIEGLEKFAGKMFHTARWDYNITGGSSADPQLTGLEGKRVGILGTGATAIQAIPQLAKYAKELHVFQRTPSHNWARGQRPTDPEEWYVYLWGSIVFDRM